MNANEIKQILLTKINKLDTQNILEKIDIDIKNNAIAFIKNEATAILFYEDMEVITHNIEANKELETFIKDNCYKIVEIIREIGI